MKQSSTSNIESDYLFDVHNDYSSKIICNLEASDGLKLAKRGQQIIWNSFPDPDTQ